MRVRLGQTGSTTAADCQLFPWQAEQGSRRTRRHPRDDPRAEIGEDVGVGVRVGPVEFQLKVTRTKDALGIPFASTNEP